MLKLSLISIFTTSISCNYLSVHVLLISSRLPVYNMDISVPNAVIQLQAGYLELHINNTS